MSDLIYHTAPQGSEEWLASRKGVITASRFKDARDCLKSGAPSSKQMTYAMDVARERAGGSVAPIFQNSAMKFGVEQEPLARIHYEAKTNLWVEEVGFITTPDRLFGVSSDGLVGSVGAIEIKTMVSSNTLFQSVVDEDISDYKDQCNGLLWLLDRQWIDLVLWCPDLTSIGKNLTIIRINRNQDDIDQLETDLVEFNKRVEVLYKKLMSKTTV